jgi:hypothetical protein
MVLGEVTESVTVMGERDPNGRRNQTVGFARGVFTDHDESHPPGAQFLDALGARDQLAFGREDAGNPNQVTGGNPCGTQGQLKTGQPLAMLPYTFRKEHPLWYEHSDACLLLDVMDSVRAYYNNEIGAQEVDFRSLTGDLYRSKNFRKVSTDFWTLILAECYACVTRCPA